MKTLLRLGTRFLGLWAIIAFSMIPLGATSLRVMNLEDLVESFTTDLQRRLPERVQRF